MSWTTNNEGRADPRSRTASRAALGLHQDDGGHQVSRGNSVRLHPPEEDDLTEPDRWHLAIALLAGLLLVLSVLEALGVPLMFTL